MARLMTKDEQSEILEVMWYLTQDLEEKCLKIKNNKKRQFVIDLYNFLNKIGYTKCRPSWEIPEDPRQTKLKI